MDLPAELLECQIKRGSVLLSDSFDDIDHAKYFAVIGISQDCIAGFFFINSRIHPMLEAKPEQYAMQYLLRKCDYPFLRYDSFLCASDIQTRSISVLAQSMIEKETILVGNLTDFDLECVLEACRESKLFTKKEKERFFS